MARSARSAAFARRARLTPSQARTVADLRLGDARALHSTGLRRHNNGVVYLCGLVIDCLLKAALLEKHPDLRSTEPELLSGERRAVWQLIYRSHELDEMLARLPELQSRLLAADARGSSRLLIALKSVCAGWTISSRYNTRTVDTHDARLLFCNVEELRPWLG